MPLVDRAIATVRLVRLQNGLIAALGVLAGAWWAAGRVSEPRTGLAAASALLLAAFANAFNDWCDVDIDRVAHPERPLPRGALSVRAAAIVAATAAVLALITSALAWLALAAVSAVVLVTMTVYSTRVKRAGVPGNLLVAVLASLPFLYGAWSVGAAGASAPLLAIAIPLHFAREVAKDLDDRAADAAVRSTLPVTYGVSAARVVVIVATVASFIALAPLMIAHHLFAALVMPAVILCALAVARVSRGRAGGALLFKTAMVCAMLSLLVTRI
jgi:geranylgeranylglycerol-phosphate geranylgeranyltransferase